MRAWINIFCVRALQVPGRLLINSCGLILGV